MHLIYGLAEENALDHPNMVLGFLRMVSSAFCSMLGVRITLGQSFLFLLPGRDTLVIMVTSLWPASHVNSSPSTTENPPCRWAKNSVILQGVSSGRQPNTIGYLVTTQFNMGGDPLKVFRVSRRNPNHKIQNIQACHIRNSCPMKKVLYRATTLR
ncbi:hypothetical protein TNCV_3418331 [Trichonephila clavipes]|nr:hypothetical protein TNCV_3418331 [Trichonephila clavipes]